MYGKRNNGTMISIKIDKKLVSNDWFDTDAFAKGCVQAFAEENGLNPHNAVAVAFKEDAKSKSALVVFGESRIEQIKELSSSKPKLLEP